MVQLPEDQEDNDGCEDVSHLEEDQVSGLTVVDEIQVATNEYKEIQNLCRFGNTLARTILYQCPQQHKNTEQMQVVSNISEDIP